VNALGLTKSGRAVAFTLYDERIGGNALIVVAERETVGADDDIVGRIAERIYSVVDIQPRDIRLGSTPRSRAPNCKPACTKHRFASLRMRRRPPGRWLSARATSLVAIRLPSPPRRVLASLP
jgi:hypothetical protein